MSRQVFPLWVFTLAALTIAATAFGVARVANGTGAIVVLALTSMWMIFVQVRMRRMGRADG